jgi:hypothetical protein
VPFIISTAYAASRIDEVKGEEDEISFTEEKDFILHSMRDGVDTFDEISCSYGALGRFQLKETMNIIKGMRSKVQEITDYFHNQ